MMCVCVCAYRCVAHTLQVACVYWCVLVCGGSGGVKGWCLFHVRARARALLFALKFCPPHKQLERPLEPVFEARCGVRSWMHACASVCRVTLIISAPRADMAPTDEASRHASRAASAGSEGNKMRLANRW